MTAMSCGMRAWAVCTDALFLLPPQEREYCDALLAERLKSAAGGGDDQRDASGAEAPAAPINDGMVDDSSW